MRGVTLVTEVVFVAIIISLIFLVYAIVSPVITTMQTSAAFDSMKSVMLEINDLVDDVASQGKGSKRSIYVTMDAGVLSVNESTDTIRWYLETSSPVISPRSMQQIGNMIAGSNLNSMAYNGTYGAQEAYILENQHLKVYVRKVGSSQSMQYYNTTQLLMAAYSKDMALWLPLKRLEISLDNMTQSMNGTGYTYLVNEGYNLPRAEAKAFISTNYIYLNNYTVTFSLEAGADFLTLRAEES